MSVVCLECRSEAKPRKRTPGSFILELFLWCLLIVPGLIYSLWRVSARIKVCRVCGSDRIIPSNTLRGQALIELGPKVEGS